MNELCFFLAAEEDLPFIAETYQKNIAALHGTDRTLEQWEELLQKPDQHYYVVYSDRPVAWFRLDVEEGGLWLGMLQVDPAYQRQGIGSYILSSTEKIAKEQKLPYVGIHTTEDNLAARALYLRVGYALIEVGPCTTADGKERVGYTFEKCL